MSLKSFKTLVFGALAALLVALPAAAQAPAASISGHVVDATGLSLPGVTVTLQGADLRQSFVTQTDGRYRFLDLAPGTYTVTSELSRASPPPSASTSSSRSARRSICRCSSRSAA